MVKKLKNDERGIAHILYIVLAIVVLAIIGVAGWRVMSKNKTPTASDGATTTTASASSSNGVSSSCLATYHDSNLCHFSEFSSDFDKTSYTAQLTVAQNGSTSSMTLESDGKGNTDLKATSNGQTINSISLNGNTYIETNGSWIEYPTGTTAPTTNPTSSMNISVGGSGLSFKYIDKEACGSLTCFKYQVTDSATPGATQYVLFDNSSYKLRQWDYSDGSGNTTDMTVSYQTVNITAPSPVQSISASL